MAPFTLPLVVKAGYSAPKKPKTDIRHNPLLDSMMAGPSHAPPAAAPQADMRHNPLLDQMMGGSHAAKPAAPHAPSASGPAPPAKGFVRLYHGGHSPTSGGGRWVSGSREYAQGYADKAGGQLHYVDIHESHPEVKSRLDEVEYNIGHRDPRHLAHFEIGEQFAKQMKPHGSAAASSPHAPASTPQSNPALHNLLSKLPAGGIHSPGTSPPPLPARGGSKPPALPKFGTRAGMSRSEAKARVREIGEHIASNFSRANPNHGDIGGEIAQRLAKHPEHVADEFRRRFGITSSDTHEEMGRKFHERQRSGWSKDPELKKPKAGNDLARTMVHIGRLRLGGRGASGSLRHAITLAQSIQHLLSLGSKKPTAKAFTLPLHV